MVVVHGGQLVQRIQMLTSFKPPPDANSCYFQLHLEGW